MQGHSGLEISTESLSEDAIKQFEGAWQSGKRPDISDFLQAFPEHSLALVIELVHIDLEFRVRHGDEPRVEQYLRQFPELKESDGVVIELIRAEFDWRRKRGENVQEDEYLQRFPGYHDQLKQLLSSDDSTHSWPKRRKILPPRDRPNISGFEIIEELGHGGMGVVYRASQPSLNRLVAIKTLILGTAATAAIKDRFRHEAEAIARLDHPHIVPIYEVGEWTPSGANASIPYFVMKYYSGGSLASAGNDPAFAMDRHARTLETIAHAVHHAHQRGILHRDLKPSNILLDERGLPHVVDFGLAGRFNPEDPQSMTATVMGTPAYMAPEQARSPSQVTTAADVYGLGAILYHLLTGQPPFRGETPLLVLEQAANQAPVKPSLLNPRIPKSLEVICLKCLEKDPSSRYESAAALAADLERQRTGQSILARPSPTWERAWRTIRRHPLITSLILMTLGVLISSVAVLAHSNLRIREQEQDTRDALEREKWMRNELLGTLGREQQLLYGKRMSSVSRLWNTNQLAQAWHELDLCPSRFRGWEWSYFDHLRRIQPITITTPAPVSAMAFISPRELLTGDARGMATIWNVDQERAPRIWQACEKSIRSIAVHRPKHWLAICDDQSLTVWNYENKKLLFRAGSGNWVAFSPDGSWLASSDEKDVLVFDTATWKVKWTLTGHRSLILNGVFAPDSRTLATASTDRTIRRWNVKDGAAVGEPWKVPLPAFRLAYLSDGKHLAAALPSSMVWLDAQTGKEIGKQGWSTVSRPLVLTGRVQIAAGPDPDLLAFNGPSNEVSLWNIRRNREDVVLRGHSLLVTSIEFSPDGNTLATFGSDQLLHIWNAREKVEYRTFGAVEWAHAMVMARDGRSVAVIPNFHSAIPGNDQIHVHQLADGKLIGRFPGAGSATFSSDGLRLISAQAGGGLACWNLADKTLVWRQPTAERCIRTELTADGRSIVAVGLNGQIFRLESATGRLWEEFNTPLDLIMSAGFSALTGRLAITGGHHVDVLEVVSKKKLASFPIPGVRRMAFSRDGEILATADNDRVVRLRDAKSGELKLTFPGHPRNINALCFNQDGRRLVTSSADGLVRIWDVETGLELAQLPGQFEENVQVMWDHVSDCIIAMDTRLHVWSVVSSTSLSKSSP